MKQSLIRTVVSADEEYLRDESKKVGYAESISFPETHEQVQEIMNECPLEEIAEETTEETEV